MVVLPRGLPESVVAAKRFVSASMDLTTIPRSLAEVSFVAEMIVFDVSSMRTPSVDPHGWAKPTVAPNSSIHD